MFVAAGGDGVWRRRRTWSCAALSIEAFDEQLVLVIEPGGPAAAADVRSVEP